MTIHLNCIHAWTSACSWMCKGCKLWSPFHNSCSEIILGRTSCIDMYTVLLWSGNCYVKQQTFSISLLGFIFSVYSMELNGLILSMLKVDPQERSQLETIMRRLENLAPSSAFLGHDSAVNYTVQI